MADNSSSAYGRAVAIVGRPNVGKSAIFNRIARRRIAIVHEESGVTRDRLVSEVSWGDERFRLVDTGGLSASPEARMADDIEAGILGQVRAAISESSAIMFVADTSGGIVPLDEEVAEVLRRAGRPVFLAANKADNPARDADAAEFERLGFPVFPVSALHDRGFEPLLEAILESLPPGTAESLPEPLKVAVVGRPNVGKSSYINRILRAERLIASNVPGTTRDSIDVPFVIGSGAEARRYLLIDTAGIRKKGKIDTSVETFGRMRAERSIRRADISVLMLDGSKEPGAQDKKIASAIVEAGKGCVIVVNKWDLSGVTQRSYTALMEKTMSFMNYCPLVFASAATGYNVRKSMEKMDEVAANLRMKLSTPALNKAIQDACLAVQPPDEPCMSLAECRRMAR